MTKFILHGGFTRELNELNDGYFQEIVRTLKDGDKVLMVLFARKAEEYDELFEREVNNIKRNAGHKKLESLLADRKKFIEQVKESAAIVILGGETEQLKEVIRSYPEFLDTIKGKVVAGSSAGAYLFSTVHSSASEGGIYKGLGVLPIKLVCHYQSESGRFDYVGEDELQKVVEYPGNLELVVLKDFEWRVFTQ